MTLDPIVTTEAEEARDTRRVAARRDRYGARSILWRESILERVRHCGRYATGDTVAIKATVDGNTSTAGLGGVQTCASVWACPVCSEKINAERRNELEAGMAAWIAQGGSVAFLTLTLSHDDGDLLEDLWNAISVCWNKTVGGSGWHGDKGKPRWARGGKKLAAEHPDEGEFTGKYCRWSIGDKREFGVEGFVRIVEVKHGDNGWHPHVHALIFFKTDPGVRGLFDLRQRMYARWEAALSREGYRTSALYGIDLRPVTNTGEVADYLTKNRWETSTGAAAYEVTGSHAKQAGKGGSTPFQLLDRFSSTGDLDLLNLWHEYEGASHNRRQMTWSKGLRDRLLLAAERTDEQIAEDDHGGDTLARIDGGDYRQIAAWGLVPDMLEAAEQGQPVLLDWLRLMDVTPLFGDHWEGQGRIYREDPALTLGVT